VLTASDHALLWLLLLEEYGVTFEYLLGMKNIATITDDWSCHDIDSLKIQGEDGLTLLSGSEKSHISKNQINGSNDYCLDLQRTSISHRIKRKGMV
jgi:hypothetical protein